MLNNIPPINDLLIGATKDVLLLVFLLVTFFIFLKGGLMVDGKTAAAGGALGDDAERYAEKIFPGEKSSLIPAMTKSKFPLEQTLFGPVPRKMKKQKKRKGTNNDSGRIQQALPLNDGKGEA